MPQSLIDALNRLRRPGQRTVQEILAAAGVKPEPYRPWWVK